jgi:hypothetical protein
VSVFHSEGSLGHASEYDFSKYTMEISPSADVPAGDFVAVFVAWTSHYFFGPNGTQTPECSVSDDAGNRYLQLCSSYPNGGQIWVGLFISQLRADLETTNTITLKHYGPGAKAVSLEQFSLDPLDVGVDRRWAFDFDRLVTVWTGAGTDPGAVAYSGLDANREYLMLHVLASYGQQSDGFSAWDADYTQIAGDGTSGHGNASGAPPPGDVQVRGGFRIVSGLSSDTVDVTASGTTRETAQALAAIVALIPDGDYPTFPNTPLIDDFNRTNEDPADGGIWDTTGNQPGFGTARTRVVANRNAMSSSGTGSGSQWTLDEMFTESGSGEFEVWGTAVTVGDLVLAMGTGSGQAATVGAAAVGYRDSSMRALNAATFPIGATFFGSTGFNGDVPGVTGVIWGVMADGEKLGLQQLNWDIWIQHLFRDFGAGWEWVAAIQRSHNPEFYSQGFFGVGFEGDTASRLDDFGGGPLTREFPQFMRRPWEYQGVALEP